MIIRLVLTIVLSLPMLVFAGDGDAWWAVGEVEPAERTDRFDYSTAYIPMRDSILLATDVYLPADRAPGEQFPTVLYQTRYIRSIEAIGLFRWLKHPIFGQISEDEVRFWIRHGYAVVLVDVRGTGASTGVRPMEFSPAEVRDGAEVVDWIIDRPWSDGRIATTGISYLGTTAELLLVNQHPAVKACIPRSNIFDLFHDITMPGGVRHSAFIEEWKNTTLNLDTFNVRYFKHMYGDILRGPSPVGSDERRRIQRAARRQHRHNFDIFAALDDFDARDEIHPALDRPIEDYSISGWVDSIAGSGTPIYRIGGWWDGALSRSALYGLRCTPNTERVVIGPWDHGPDQNISPFAESDTVRPDLLTDMLRFLDHHLRGVENGIDTEPRIRYYTIGREAWSTSEVWPPRDVRNDTLMLTTSAGLRRGRAGTRQQTDTLDIDYTVGTGPAAGWNSLTGTYRPPGGRIAYPDRSVQDDRSLIYRTPPLEEPYEITGHPVVDLQVSIPTVDGHIFAYLEQVAPDGTAQYITEGQLRLVHRAVGEDPRGATVGPYHSFHLDDMRWMTPDEPTRVTFETIPTSWQIPAGHAIQLRITGADADHFSLPDVRPDELRIHHHPETQSILVLPRRSVGDGSSAPSHSAASDGS